MKITSAYANKMLRQLEEEKGYWVAKERECSTYVCADGEEPLIPEYNYEEVAATLKSIDEKIVIVKHALNMQNVNAQIPVGDGVMSVDEILVRMAQLNRRKITLDEFRRRQPKERLQSRVFSNNRGQVTEYLYTNYDIDAAKKEYEETERMIMEMQIALDRHNQTELFEVAIS